MSFRMVVSICPSGLHGLGLGFWEIQLELGLGGV